MKMMTRTMIVLLALATAACTNPDRFGGAGGTGAGGADGLNGANGGVGGLAGSASDPTSPQFFNQTIGDRTNTDYRAVIEGHADEQGTREYNLALGFRRANAIREYLVSRGVPSGRLQTTSFGKERPVEVCSQESCYANNRRAVTVLSFSAITS